MSLNQISKYFTINTLESILKKNGAAKYLNYEFGEKFNKGDSYLSDVFRLKVIGMDDNGKTIVVQLIVKSMPKIKSRRKIFRSATFFRNEINFYEKVIPALEEFQSNNQKNPFIEYPKCFASYSDGENDFIALENVSFNGFGAPIRQSYCDLKTCHLIMKTLGRFHAVSLAFKDQDPIKFENVTKAVEETYYSENLREWYGGFVKVAVAVANDAVSRSYPDSIYEKNTREFLGNGFYDRMIELVSKKSKLSVIGHGDCWQPNFLTKYSNDLVTPEAVTMIDFQLARYGSPVLDIIFFIYTCTSDEQRKKHFNEFIDSYHKSACDLIDNLKSDSKKILPLSALQEELKTFGKFGCGFCIESVPLSMLEDDEIVDLDSVEKDDATLLDFWKIKPLVDEKKRDRLASLFKHATDNNYF